jgi:hypothetical protein
VGTLSPFISCYAASLFLSPFSHRWYLFGICGLIALGYPISNIFETIAVSGKGVLFRGFFHWVLLLDILQEAEKAGFPKKAVLLGGGCVYKLDSESIRKAMD